MNQAFISGFELKYCMKLFPSYKIKVFNSLIFFLSVLFFSKSRFKAIGTGYCENKPQLIDPSPPAGSTFIVDKKITIKLKAKSLNGEITRFQVSSFNK